MSISNLAMCQVDRFADIDNSAGSINQRLPMDNDLNHGTEIFNTLK